MNTGNLIANFKIGDLVTLTETCLLDDGLSNGRPSSYKTVRIGRVVDISVRVRVGWTSRDTYRNGSLVKADSTYHKRTWIAANRLRIEVNSST